MSELIPKDAALGCFHDWIDRYGNEHTADEDATYQRIAELPAVQPDHTADIGKKVSISCGHENDLISRRAAIALAKDIYVPMGDDEVYRTRSIDPQEVRGLPAVQPVNMDETPVKNAPNSTSSGSGEGKHDLIDRQAAIDVLEKCYTCKHVYQRVSDADTLYCRCRKGCRYEEFKPKRSTGNPQWHEGEN